jgi:chromosome segregation ATPase
MTSDAEKLFDEIEALQIQLRSLREVRQDLQHNLQQVDLEIGQVRLRLVAKGEQFNRLTESANGSLVLDDNIHRSVLIAGPENAQ